MKGQKFIVAYEDKNGFLHLESSVFMDHNQAIKEAKTWMMNTPYTDYVILKEVQRVSYRPERKFAKAMFETAIGGNFKNL